jgi:hypothetical protein
VADAGPGRRPALLEHTRPFFALIRREVLARGGREIAGLAPIDPAHLASTVAGSTVFLVAAMPALVPQLGMDPLSREHLEAHREEVLRVVRRLLGTRGPQRSPRRAAKGETP